MAYTNAQATPRADIAAFVSEANADINKLFIADKVMPVITVDAKIGIYMKATLAKGELLNGDAIARAAGDGYNRVNRSYETAQYDCVEYGLESVIDDSYEKEVERFFNLEGNEAALLERSLKISQEVRVAAAIMNSSNFTATAALVAYTNALLTTINFPGDVAEAKNRLLKDGIIANTVVMSADLYERVRRSTLLQNQVFGVVAKTAGQNFLPGEADIANAIGVDNLYVAKAAKNSNGKGQTYSGGFIWGTTYIWVGQVASGDWSAGGAGRIISWGKDSTGLFTPETYRDDSRRSNVLRVRQTVAEKIIDGTAGELITTSWS